MVVNLGGRPRPRLGICALDLAGFGNPSRKRGASCPRNQLETVILERSEWIREWDKLFFLLLVITLMQSGKPLVSQNERLNLSLIHI